MNPKVLEQAIDAGGGLFAFARALGLTHGAISSWRRQGRIPAEWAIRVHDLTGIPCAKLRPDIYPEDRVKVRRC